MIQQERIQLLNTQQLQKNKYIFYWMQQSQRTDYNHALEHAIFLSNKYEKPLIVFFGLTENFPEANIRHYSFMIQGLLEVEQSLKNRGIKFLFNHISPEEGIIKLSKYGCMIIVDKGYLKIQKQWRNRVSERIKCPLIQVESDVVIPVEVASLKEEYSAATFRKKIKNKYNTFLSPLQKEKYKQNYIDKELDSIDIKNFSTNKIDNSIKKVDNFVGGTDQAIKYLHIFLEEKINDYPEKRNDPNLNFVSNLSPYLHFGQISPLKIVLSVLEKNNLGQDAFLEELIVRRELSINFVNYNFHYDQFDCLPDWAKKTLNKHQNDKREYIYSLDEFENAETHDPYWNAAQKQMREDGKMHGYMRMYWGKKILEWSEKPQIAFEIALYLNNKYELDGRDPNGYSGVAWCFGKHDRPWAERPIFGNIRYMNANGLKRKFDIENFSKKYGE